MKKSIWFLAAVVAFFPSIVHATDAAVAQPADSPYQVLESLVGGVWVATLPPQKDGSTIGIELRLVWNENKQGVHFDSTWLVGDKRAPYTSGMYAWNAAKKSLVIYYTDSSGSLTEGSVTREGNVLAHEMTVTNKDGSIDRVRTRLSKLGGDAFTNEIFVEKDGAWTKFVEVRYKRRA
jgi:hypothetical protein